ncbi:MAG: hypothetical protein QOH06_778 [Acidobacteriota bacterium]|jgi:protein-arginine kinase activator protein McsA|nr:hypothetical protein [Acidobacteriota bacterium]
MRVLQLPLNTLPPQEFEEAAALRDQLKELRELQIYAG